MKRVEGGTTTERVLAALTYLAPSGLREQAVARLVGESRAAAAEGALRELERGGLAELQSDQGPEWRVWRPTLVGRRRALELLAAGTCAVYKAHAPVDVLHSPPRRHRR